MKGQQEFKIGDTAILSKKVVAKVYYIYPSGGMFLMDSAGNGYFRTHDLLEFPTYQGQAAEPDTKPDGGNGLETAGPQ